MTCDFTHVPCFIHKPQTLGECGCPPIFADDEWMREESRKHMEAQGAAMAERVNQAVLDAIRISGEDPIGDRFRPVIEAACREFGRLQRQAMWDAIIGSTSLPPATPAAASLPPAG
jgi:hypothetical protein